MYELKHELKHDLTIIQKMNMGSATTQDQLCVLFPILVIMRTSDASMLIR